MRYEIYCDESCVEALFDKEAHKYAVIGGVWIPADYRGAIKNSINHIKSQYHMLGEMKWNKISPSNEKMYIDLIDLFFSTYQVRFRAICIETEKINHVSFNNGSGELGFYKFYFQLIQHWLLPDNEYYLYVDHKINRNKHRVHDLGKILQYSSNSIIAQAQALPSQQSVLIQLADVLTGSVAASFNSSINEHGSKNNICQRIEQYIGHEIQSTSIAEQKFNVFDINLRKGW